MDTQGCKGTFHKTESTYPALWRAERPSGSGAGFAGRIKFYFYKNGKNDCGVRKHLQGLWRKKTDRWFFLYLFEGRQGWIYRTKRLWKVYFNENYCRHYSTGFRAGYHRTDCENGILCAGNSLRKKWGWKWNWSVIYGPKSESDWLCKGYSRIYSDCGRSHICICFIGAFLISAGKTVQSDWKTVRRGKEKIKSASGTGDIPELYSAGWAYKQSWYSYADNFRGLSGSLRWHCCHGIAWPLFPW